MSRMRAVNVWNRVLEKTPPYDITELVNGNGEI